LKTLNQALAEATATLSHAGVDHPGRTASLLLEYLLNVDRTYLLTRPDDELGEKTVLAYAELVRRRAKHEPLQYIVGRQEFYGFLFKVTPDVLIPRPETEHLIETVLELLRHRETSEQTPSPLIVDAGTGSGCIAITLALLVPNARVIAIDVSKAALDVAAENVKSHGVGSRVELIQGDLLRPLLHGDRSGTVDVIASNPPYVAGGELAMLQREVGEHEPRIALSGGEDGLDFYRRLLSEAPALLKPDGHLVFEIGYRQSDAIRALIDTKFWRLVRVTEDLQGIPRTLTLEKAG